MVRTASLLSSTCAQGVGGRRKLWLRNTGLWGSIRFLRDVTSLRGLMVTLAPIFLPPHGLKSLCPFLPEPSFVSPRLLMISALCLSFSPAKPSFGFPEWAVFYCGGGGGG
ncbi:hypothetical protein DPEC_G00185770 [Dallia pectoralis]|uniref:Uncharacterized protein n=1 Tax=Dallia pectoralis TaxID=75939 RepID=A0ACC2GB65_DALPE|nr:hypothetical protein DPEC_G00185770 [Dallia pectoralis]